MTADTDRPLEPVVLGIDLAAQPERTAACRLWCHADGRIELERIWTRAEDRFLLELSTDTDVIAIDAPFGFPARLTDALPVYAQTGRWPQRPEHDDAAEWTRGFRFRETDRQVHRSVKAERALVLPRGRLPAQQSVQSVTRSIASSAATSAAFGLSHCRALSRAWRLGLTG